MAQLAHRHELAARRDKVREARELWEQKRAVVPLKVLACDIDGQQARSFRHPIASKAALAATREQTPGSNASDNKGDAESDVAEERTQREAAASGTVVDLVSKASFNLTMSSAPKQASAADPPLVQQEGRAVGLEESSQGSTESVDTERGDKLRHSQLESVATSLATSRSNAAKAAVATAEEVMFESMELTRLHRVTKETGSQNDMSLLEMSAKAVAAKEVVVKMKKSVALAVEALEIALDNVGNTSSQSAQDAGLCETRCVVGFRMADLVTVEASEAEAEAQLYAAQLAELEEEANAMANGVPDPDLATAIDLFSDLVKTAKLWARVKDSKVCRAWDLAALLDQKASLAKLAESPQKQQLWTRLDLRTADIDAELAEISVDEAKVSGMMEDAKVKSDGAQLSRVLLQFKLAAEAKAKNARLAAESRAAEAFKPISGTFATFEHSVIGKTAFGDVMRPNMMKPLDSMPFLKGWYE